MRPCASTDGPGVVDLVVAAGLFTRDEAGFLTEGVLEGDGATCLVEDAEEGEGAGEGPRRGRKTNPVRVVITRRRAAPPGSGSSSGESGAN